MIKLKLLDQQEERFVGGVVITTHQIIATVRGRDKVVDYPNCRAQAETKLAAWQAKNPGIPFRISGK